MQTLDELCTFLGFSVGALEVARVGGPADSSLALAGVLIKGFDDATPTSLAGLIDAVQNLSPLTLDARLLSDRGGEEPYELRVWLSPSPSIVWSTRLQYILAGGLVFGENEDFGAAGGDINPTWLGPGTWEIVAIREGIGSFGLTVLQKSLGTVVVTQLSGLVPPTPQPPVVVVPNVPLVTCQISIDGDNPGFGGFTNFVVSGGGFEAEEPVDVFEGNEVSHNTQSDGLGRFAVKVGILHSFPAAEHVFFARGQRSKLESWKAGVTV